MAMQKITYTKHTTHTEKNARRLHAMRKKTTLNTGEMTHIQN